MSYYISGLFGFVVLILLIIAVKEPERRMDVADRVTSEDVDLSLSQTSSKKSFWENLISGESGFVQVFRALFRTPVIMLLIAASVRHTG